MDKKAEKILMNTFWSFGWKSTPPVLAGEDFEYAKSQGLMFDPVTVTHDEIILRLQELHRTMTKEQVASAFLHSLSTKKVHLRSVLSSWALTSKMPLHTYGERSAVRPNYSSCGDCNHHGLMSDTPRKRLSKINDFDSMAEWQGEDGYSEEAVAYYFGGILRL